MQEYLTTPKQLQALYYDIGGVMGMATRLAFIMDTSNTYSLIYIVFNGVLYSNLINVNVC